MQDSTIHFVAGAEDAGKRLDQVLPEKLKREGHTVSRSVVQDWIRAGLISIAGNVVKKPRLPMNDGDEISVAIPEEKPLELLPEKIPLTVLFEDEDIIVIDKPSGLVVHPGAGNNDGTLVNALLYHCKYKLSRDGDADRPGIVHRLDKDTSGCLVAAKTETAYHSLVAQFSGRTTSKEYLAIVDGTPFAMTGRLENRIGRNPKQRQKMTVLEPPSGKEAITEYDVEFSDEEEKWSRVRCHILTGRTHQIRVHMKESLRCAILGDPIYGKISKQRAKVSRLMLHAKVLEISHPISGERMQFESNLPSEFEPYC